jgi:hypothetical protein
MTSSIQSGFLPVACCASKSQFATIATVSLLAGMTRPCSVNLDTLVVAARIQPEQAI